MRRRRRGASWARIGEAPTVNRYRGRAPERLPVSCWCGLRFFIIPASEVGQRTESCGAVECDQLAREAGQHE